MNKKNFICRYIVKINPKIAGSIAALCPQESIGCSLAKFIETQYSALERERNELICQDCIVSLPVEIVDALKWMYPNLSFSDQVINAVRTLLDLSTSDSLDVDSLDIKLRSEVEYYRTICDMPFYYAIDGGSDGDDEVII